MNGRCHKLGRLIITDRFGRPRMELSVADDGVPYLQVMDYLGKVVHERRFEEAGGYQATTQAAVIDKARREYLAKKEATAK